MPTYHFICIGSVWYTINSGFVFWSFLNYLISQIFSMCSWLNLPTKRADHAWIHPAHSPVLFAEESKGSNMPRTITPTTHILISTELHPCIALLILLSVLGVWSIVFILTKTHITIDYKEDRLNSSKQETLIIMWRDSLCPVAGLVTC